MQAYLHSETMRVVPTYLVLGTLALLWAFEVLITKVPDTTKEDVSREDAGPAKNVPLFQRILCWLWWRSFFTLARRWAHGVTSFSTSGRQTGIGR